MGPIYPSFFDIFSYDLLLGAVHTSLDVLHFSIVSHELSILLCQYPKGWLPHLSLQHECNSEVTIVESHVAY